MPGAVGRSGGGQTDISNKLFPKTTPERLHSSYVSHELTRNVRLRVFQWPQYFCQMTSCFSPSDTVYFYFFLTRCPSLINYYHDKCAGYFFLDPDSVRVSVVVESNTARERRTDVHPTSHRLHRDCHKVI